MLLVAKKDSHSRRASIRIEIMGCGATKAAMNVSEPRQLAAAEETRVTPAAPPAATTTGQVQDGPSVLVCNASGPPHSVLRAHTTCLCCESTRAALVSRAAGNIDSSRCAPGSGAHRVLVRIGGLVRTGFCRCYPRHIQTHTYIDIHRIHIHKHTCVC